MGSLNSNFSIKSQQATCAAGKKDYTTSNLKDPRDCVSNCPFGTY